MNDEVIELQGTIIECLPKFIFKVELVTSGHNILATTSSKLKMNFIRFLPGDKVTVEVSPFNLSKGLITWKY